MLNNLTLILPTYEKHAFVRRLLLYYSRCNAKIIVADGSFSPLFDNEDSQFGNLKLQYIHDPGAKTLLKRMHTALKLVDTEYFCFLDDGDILLTSGLSKSIEYLNSHPKLNFASGRVAAYHGISQSNEMFDVVPIYNWGHWSNPYSSERKSNPADTLNLIVDEIRTASFFYTVLRTNPLKDALLGALKLDFSQLDPVELVISGIISLSSSFTTGNFPYWMRGMGTSVPKELWGKDFGREHWAFPKYAEEIIAAADYSAKAASEFGFGLVDREDFIQYFERHRLSSGSLKITRKSYYKKTIEHLLKIFKKKNKGALLSPVDYWSFALGRDLTVDEINDLNFFEGIIRIFPQGAIDWP